MQVLWAIIGERARKCVPYSRVAGIITTLSLRDLAEEQPRKNFQLWRINSLLQKCQRETLPLFPSSFVLMSLEKLIVSFFPAWSRYARNWRFILLEPAVHSRTRVFVILSRKKERDERKKIERIEWNRRELLGEREVRKMVFANCKRSETNAG